MSFTLPPMNMPYGVTPMSHDIYDLHMITFYICCGIGLLVFSTLFYTLFKHRKSKGATPAHFHHHFWVEVVWTTIPFLILLGLAIPATMVLARIHNTDRAKLNVKITGHQWYWQYEYMDYDINFNSNLATPQAQIDGVAKKDKWYLLKVDHAMVVPINQKIRLLITSDDVLHDWWVPELGLKQDAIPGYINENWIYVTKPGVYRGQCGELCGVRHAFMPIVVKAVTSDQFKIWLNQHKQKNTLKPKAPSVLSKRTLMKMGKQTYQATCAMCHQSNGAGLAPAFPGLKGAPLVVSSIDKTLKVVVHGAPGTAMQAFAHQLDDKHLAGVVTYIRNAWGNDALNQQHQHRLVVQPKDVANAE